MKKTNALAAEDAHLERLDTAGGGPRLGEWYWVIDKEHRDGEPEEWLGCAMKIGSNFVEIHSPEREHHGYSYVRVHFDNYWTQLRHEPDAQNVIRKRIEHHRDQSRQLLVEVHELTARLGMAPSSHQNAASGALMVLSAQTDIKAYSRALTKAKDVQLPELYNKIKEEHEWLATWMRAPAMPMRAEFKRTKEDISDIDDRIFSIELYAGLTEQCVQCRKGNPASASEKLHVMQRMLFMDEESLLGYKTGGMEFKDIKAFDKFMALNENRDRILPYPRTLAAMRVRRNTKDRHWDGTLSCALINLNLEKEDAFTFLYIRNGDQVWRLSCEMDFGELIFPDPSVFNPKEPKMFKDHFGDVKFISVHEYEERMEKERVRVKMEKKWRKENPGKDDWMRNPYRDHWEASDLNQYERLDPSSVYYDEGMAAIEKQIKAYNRVALIIQGLFDRSTVLHPHAPVKSWTEDGFNAAITLVNDGTAALNYGEAPDFEAYRSACNESLGEESVTTGQQDYWQRREALKENGRRRRDYRVKHHDYPTHYKPYGNPGPLDPAKVDGFSASRGALFKWERERMTPARTGTWSMNYDDIQCSIRVPISELFNVSAYQPGDFKQFFRDPRTRQQYLKWAPMLLAAEEYVAKHPNPPRKKHWTEMFA